MLRYTPEQEGFILNSRIRFNDEQLAIQPGYLLGNALPLHRDAWARYDRDAVMLQRSKLAVFNDLAATLSEPVPIGVLVAYFQQVSDSGGVNVSLDGRSKGKQDLPQVSYVGTPLPIYDDTVTIGWRQAAAETQAGFGNMLQNAGLANAQRKILEKVEDAALNGLGTSVVVDGNQVYGLLTHPQRGTDTHGVDLNGATGDQWKDAFAKLIAAINNNNFYDRITVYVNWSDWTYAQLTMYNTANGSNRTIAEFIQAMPNVAAVVPASSVPVNTIAGVVKRSDVVRVLNAMPLSTRPKSRRDPEEDYVLSVMMATAVQWKYDADGQAGFAVVTKT